MPHSGGAEVGGVPVRIQTSSNPRLALRVASRSHLKLTEIRYGHIPSGTSDIVPDWGEMFTVSLRLTPQISEASVLGKLYRTSAQAGDAVFFHLPSMDYVEFITARHSLELLLSRDFLDELAEDLEAPRITRIGQEPTITRDSVLSWFGRLVQPHLDGTSPIDPLWADQFMWAFGTYVGATHGDLVTKRQKVGGLSRWQERLATEVMEATLVDGIRLTQLAAMCGLRTSQFAHAFTRSFGISPYQWLVHRRIEKAKGLILHGHPLTEAAMGSGFADQSHMIRTFRRIVGQTPRAWRQMRGTLRFIPAD